MSLVTTAMFTSSARCSHNVAMMVLLPVPTGPTMPSRNGRSAVLCEWSCEWSCECSDNENPPRFTGVTQRPLLDVGGCQCRKSPARIRPDRLAYRLLDRVARIDNPPGCLDRVHRQQFERGRRDRLRVLVQTDSGKL